MELSGLMAHVISSKLLMGKQAYGPNKNTSPQGPTKLRSTVRQSESPPDSRIVKATGRSLDKSTVSGSHRGERRAASARTGTSTTPGGGGARWRRRDREATSPADGPGRRPARGPPVPPAGPWRTLSRSRPPRTTRRRHWRASCSATRRPTRTATWLPAPASSLVSPRFVFGSSTRLVKIWRFVANCCARVSRIVDRMQLRALLGIAVLLLALDIV